MAQTGKTRLQIIIEWLQKNAGLPKKTQAQVVKLRGGVNATLTPVAGLNKQMFGLHKNVKNLGFSLGWFGYRLSVLGRMILRSAIDPVKQMAGMLSGWESGLNDIGMALALQRAGISETAMSNEELAETMRRLPQEGLVFQGTMAGLQAVMSDLAIRAGPALNRLFLALGELMKGIGGEIIVSMIHGFANAIEFVTYLGNKFTWLGPVLGRLMAGLAAVSPLLITMGAAMFMLGPLFIAPLALVFAKLMLVVVAIGMLITFWGDLIRAIRGGWEWVQKVLNLGPGKGPGASATNVPGGMTRSSEATIYQNIEVGSIQGDIDLARASDEIANRTADGVTRAQWNGE